MRLQGMVGDHITIRPAGSGWRPPDWITNPELQQGSKNEAPAEQRHAQTFDEGNTYAPKSDIHRRPFRKGWDENGMRDAPDRGDLWSRVGRRSEGYDVEMGAERDDLLVDRDSARNGTTFPRRKGTMTRAKNSRRKGFAQHGNLTYWQRVLALALSLFVGLSLLGIIATLLSAKLDVLETKLDERVAIEGNNLYPPPATNVAPFSESGVHGRKLLASQSTGIKASFESVGSKKEPLPEPSMLSSMNALGRAIYTFARISTITNDDTGPSSQPIGANLLIGSLQAGSSIASQAVNPIQRQSGMDHSSLGPRPSAEDLTRLSASLKQEIQNVLIDMLNGKAGTPLQIPDSSDGASPALLINSGAETMTPAAQLTRVASNMKNEPKQEGFVPATINEGGSPSLHQDERGATRTHDNRNMVANVAGDVGNVRAARRPQIRDVQRASDTGRHTAIFAAGSSQPKEIESFVPVSLNQGYPDPGMETYSDLKERNVGHMAPSQTRMEPSKSTPPFASIFPGANNHHENSLWIPQPEHKQQPRSSNLSPAEITQKMVPRTTHSNGPAPERIEMWDVASGKKVCRLYRACKMEDGSLLLPQWMEIHKERIKSDCGISKVKFIIENAAATFSIRQEKNHFPTGKHLGFGHASRDVFGISAPRDHMPHFVTDSLKPLASIEAVLGSGRGQLPFSMITPQTGRGHPETGKTSFQSIAPTIQLYEGTMKRATTEWVPGVVDMFRNVGFEFCPAGQEKPDNKGSQSFGSTGMCFRSIIANNLKQYMPHGMLDKNGQNVIFTRSGLSREDVATLESTRDSPCTLSVTALTRKGPRALLNLPELEKAIAGMGYQMGIKTKFNVVDFSTDVPFQDQVRIMETSNALVATHGAGNANYIFMRPNAAVIEIFPFSYRAGPFNLFAEIFGLDYRYAMAAPQTDVFKECMARHEKKANIKSYVFNLWDQAVALHDQQPGVHMLHFETEFGKPGQSEGMTTRKCARMQELEFDTNHVASMVLEAGRRQCQRAQNL